MYGAEEERLSVLDSLVLESGGHESWEKGACVMEAVAYVAGEPFSDHPKCASKVITSFLISWNDALDDGDRQMLKPLIPLVVGTRTTVADERTRAWMCTDWLARECAPAMLRLAGLTEHAEKLEQLGALTGAREAKAAQPTLDAARKDAAAAGDAAGAAATAAWDAARAVAGAAARDAAGAAGDAARTAAGAAWAAAGAAAGAVARDAARAAWAAAGAAKGDYAAKYHAAYKAARAVFDENPPEGLAEVTKALQLSAYQLVERMCEVGRKDKPSK